VGARIALAALIAAAASTPAAAQSAARVSADSVVAMDQFVGQNAAGRPNIVIDVAATVRLGGGWMLYVRPWFRQPRANTWDKEIYQAALQYERSGDIATRVDLGYIVSPIGLGMMDTRPGVNPTILPHLSYLTPMPAFDAGAPRVQPIAATYPLGAQITGSTARWDARAAIIAAPPNRVYILNSPGSNPATRPVLAVGGGFTPTIGLRLGVSFAAGEYVTGSEMSRTASNGRSLRMVSFEGEYAFGYSKFSGEFTRDGLETGTGSATAYAWFVQGVHTITPRWFAAARQEGTNAPPLPGAVAPGNRSALHMTEATIGYRLSTDFTLRSSVVARKPFNRHDWDQQVGASIVWAHRWK
jgi:hypothetical protein